MGILKALWDAIPDAAELAGAGSSTPMRDYVWVYCKYCGEKACGADVSRAIKRLQNIYNGCGHNCHTPEVAQ